MESHQCYEHKAVIWKEKSVWTFEVYCGIDGDSKAWKASMNKQRRECMQKLGGAKCLSTCLSDKHLTSTYLVGSACHSVLWLWWERRQKAMAGNNAWVVFCIKDSHIRWKILSFVLRKPTLAECVKWNDSCTLSPPPPPGHCCEPYTVCVLPATDLKCGTMNWSWQDGHTK